jgi:Fic family protein
MALADILQSIDALKEVAGALRPVAPDRLQALNQKLRLDWNYNSNAIEGNTLTLSETRMLLLHDYHMGNKLGRHYEEIKLHDHVLLTLEELVRQNEPMTEVLIRSLHHELMGDEYFVKANDSLGNVINVKGKPGEYKVKANGVNRIVNGKEIFVPFKTPDEVRAEMPELIRWYRAEEEKAGLHPVMLAAIFHFRFVTLHPFDDGNGRMSRILMNMILMRSGYVPAIIRMAERPQYLSTLAQAQDGGTIEPFIELVANDTKRSLELLIKAAKGESIEEPDDLDKEIELLKQKIKNDDIVKIDINNQEYRPIWIKEIVKLYISAHTVIQKFSELFEDTETSLYIKNMRYIDSDQIIQQLEVMSERGIYLLSYKLSSYKSSYNHFDLSSSIIIHLHEFSYELKLIDCYNEDSFPNTKEYRYDQIINSETINIITNNISKGILKAIKQRTSQK